MDTVQTKTVEQFDFASADLEDYVNSVEGFNVFYRRNMQRHLAADEMLAMKVEFETITALQLKYGGGIMTPAYHAGFITLFNMNSIRENWIS